MRQIALYFLCFIHILLPLQVESQQPFRITISPDKKNYDYVASKTLLENAKTYTLLLPSTPFGSLQEHGEMGTLTHFSYQGLGARATVVELDGIHVNDTGQNAFDFSMISPNQLSLFAFTQTSYMDSPGGTLSLSLIPQSAQKNVFLTAESGSFESYRIATGGQKHTQKGRIFLSLQQRHQGAAQPIHPDLKNTHRFHQTALHTGLTYALSPKLSLTASFLHTNQNLNELYNPVYATFTTNTHFYFGQAAFTYTPAHQCSHSLSLGGYAKDETYISSTISRIKDISLQAHYTGKYLYHIHTIKWGLHNTLQQRHFDKKYRLSILRAYLQYQRPLFGAGKFETSMTSHHQPKQSAQFSGYIKASYPLNTSLTLLSILRSSLRLPTLLDLYDNPYYKGNPSLKPEKGTHILLGASFHLGTSHTLDIMAGHISLKRMIYGRQLSPSPQRYQQQNGQFYTATSFEARYTYSSENITGTLAYTYLQPHSKTKKLLQNGIPQHKITFNTSLPIGKNNCFILNGLYMGRRKSYLGTPLNSYILTNVLWEYQLSPSLNSYFKIENLFNSSYEIVSGYPMPGRGYYVGFRMRF